MTTNVPRAPAPIAAGPVDRGAAEGSPFDLLAEDHDAGHRWAFGTGFTDPLEGIDTAVPDGLDPAALARYCLALADDALIYSHRLQQWVARLPELEEETAVANIALDLLGQARMLLSRAGAILGKTEDELAFFRDEKDFRNVRLTEHADRDFAELVVRLLIFSTWRLAQFESLAAAPPPPASAALPGAASSPAALGAASSAAVPGASSLAAADPVLAAIAAKAVNELAYHRDYAARWVIRLGDGTDLSRAKTQAALDTLWPLVGELFRPDPAALAVTPVGTVDPGAFDAIIDTVIATATLDRPTAPPLAPVGGRTGRDGVHTEALSYVLAELQSVARAHPDATW